MNGLTWFFVILALSILLAFCVVAILVSYILHKRKSHKVHVNQVAVAHSCTDTSSRESSEDIEAAKNSKPKTSQHIFHGLPTNQKIFEAPPPPISPELDLEDVNNFHKTNMNISHSPRSNKTLSLTSSKRSIGKRQQDNSVVVVVDDVPNYNPNMPYGIEIGGFSKCNKKVEDEELRGDVSGGPLPGGKIREKTTEEKKGSGNRPLNIALPNSINNHVAKPPRRELIPISITNYPKRLEELNENESAKLYDEFELLEKSKPSHTTAFSSSQSTRKNRFYDIVPFEYNRVVLKYGGGPDYINASFINNTEGERSYIAAQGPIGESECAGGRRDSTISDFWRLVWQEDIDCIIMLTQLVEGLRSKCSSYWPENAGDTIELDYGLCVKFYCIVEDENSFQREFLLYDGSNDPPKKVLQWHFKKWRDGSAPENKASLLHFIKQVRASPHSNPILVHCSAGVGRTGVFIAIDQLLDKIEDRQNLDIFGVVNSLRGQRQNMVQNIDQYATIYDVIALAVRQKLGKEKDKDELTSLDRNKWLSDDSSIH